MKKQFLLFSMLFTFFTYMVSAQDTLISAYDNGVLGWSTWGAPLSIEKNPSLKGNLSDSVALLDQKGGAWSGMANWNDNSLLDSTVVAIAVDAYFANTGGTLKLACDNSILGARNLELYKTVPADKWTTVIFDITAYDTLDYKQIAFQSSVADSLMVDNVRILKAIPEDAGNLVKGGGMENEAAWNFYWGTNATDNFGSYEFNFTGDTVNGGSNGSYKVSATDRSGSFLWQPVTLIPNHIYSLDGVFKNLSIDSLTGAWMEMFIRKAIPTGGDFSIGNDEYGYTLYGDKGVFDFEGTFGENFTTHNNPTNFVLPSNAPTQWYLVIKAGIWNEGAYQPTFDVIFDEIELVDLGVNTTLAVNRIVVGSVENADDYTCNVDITWDADSVYMAFDVTDDSIYIGETDVWNDDNIEIYFDMDNSKTPTWPRNAGWPATSYDDNDYQLRIEPGAAAEISGLVSGIKYKCDTTVAGYSFVVNIPWESLLTGFSAVEGTEIGFDVLASDNDNDGDGRNQITWNARSEMTWNDASLFGTLKLDADNSLTPVLDSEVPSAPGNLAAADSTITWDASTDNIAVFKYIVFKANTAIDTLYALETGNKFVFNGLPIGTTNVGVTAVDNSGNKSTKATVDIIIEEDENSIDNSTADLFSVYPNPSNGTFNIKAVNNVPVAIEVYSITGNLVKSDVFTSNYKLELAQGVYFLYLKTDNKTNVTKLLVE